MTTLTTARGSILQARTTPADSIARFVPVIAGDPHVGAGQRLWLVNAVADHRDALSLSLQRRDGAVFVCGEDLGEHFVDAQIAGHRFGHRPGVSGNDHHTHAALPWRASNRLGLLPGGLSSSSAKAPTIWLLRTTRRTAAPRSAQAAVCSDSAAGTGQAALAQHVGLADGDVAVF